MDKKINSIISYLFIISIFISPLIFSASPLFSFQFSKTIPFFVILFAAVFFWSIQIFNEGKMVFPKQWIFVAAFAVPFVYIISSFASINPPTSFMGTGTEIGTASFIGALFIFMFLVSMFVRSKEKMFISYLAFGLSFTILAVFHILRFIFGAQFLSFGIFGSVISNTVGRFSDLSLLSGIAVILSLTLIEFVRLGRGLKAMGYTILILSLIMLAMTNFPILIWGSNVTNSMSIFTLIGFFALVFFVYFVSSSYERGSRVKSVESEDEERSSNKKTIRRVPTASLVVLIISIIFTIGFLPLQSMISSFFKLDSSYEARLLWQPTAALSWSTVSHLPWYRSAFGYGPNEFAYKWMLDKPLGINNTTLWDTEFTQGVGFVPSTVVTVGGLGFIAWIVFIVLFLLIGFKTIFKRFKDPFSHYLTISSFLVSLYLWIAAIIYTPSIVTFVLTFFFTGLYFASLFREGVFKEKEIIFDKSKGKSFVFIMSLILGLIFFLFWAYQIGIRVVASVYANKASIALSQAKNLDDVEKAKVYLESAATLVHDDSYYQSLARISLAEANSMLQDTTTPPDTLKSKLKDVYSQALAAANNAVILDPTSFDNLVTLGNVFEIVVPLGVDKSYENAKIAYQAAGKLNPKSPLIPYLLAQLEVDNKNLNAAKTEIGTALQLKQYYLDAIILLGRIQYNQGDTSDALNTFMVAQEIDPTNANIQATINVLKNGGSAPQPSASSTTATTSNKAAVATSTKKK
jgi:tetratricopeptide (TPR) repeat protein